MRADDEDQLNPQRVSKRFPIVELALALVVIAGLLVLWFYWEETTRPAVQSLDVPPTHSAPPAATEMELPPTPDIPRQAKPAPVATPASKTVTVADETDASITPGPEQPIEEIPLTREEGDELVRQQLASTGTQPSLDKLMGNERPLDATAAIFDGLGRGLILRKIVQASPPQPGFSVQRQGDIIYMDPASYARYDGIASTVSAMDTTALVETFHVLRPLYENAYRKLGLDPEDFDNSIIRTLDLVLATPEINEPIALKPRSVTYLYADPALESLPSVQKQLLRMGPENIRRLKGQAQALRDALIHR